MRSSFYKKINKAVLKTTKQTTKVLFHQDIIFEINSIIQMQKL